MEQNVLVYLSDCNVDYTNWDVRLMHTVSSIDEIIPYQKNKKSKTFKLKTDKDTANHNNEGCKDQA